MSTLGRPHAALALIMLIALAHGLIYALGLPLWQTPDEPMLYEYAALTAELGRIPASQDRSPDLEARLAAALDDQGFWGYLLGSAPEPPPATMDEAQQLFPMPRQVGGDPPVYFALAALPLRLTAGWGIAAQARLLRLLNALLLPLAALCAYAIARELGAPQEAGLAAAGLLALQPMYAFIGAGLSNDGPANLAAAALCLLIVRAIRRGLPGREVIAGLALALLALQIKRTTLPLALAAAILAAAWTLRWALGGGWRPARTLLPAACLVAAVAGGAWLNGQIAWGEADRWYDAHSLFPAERTALRSGYALKLAPGHEATQTLPDVATTYLRNGTIEVGARIWCDGPSTVRLIVDTGVRRQETRFALDGVADAEMAASVGSIASRVRLSVAADDGPLYVGQIWMHAVGRPGGLITNGDLSRPALRYDSPLVPMSRYLRVGDLIWMLESGRSGWGLDVGSGARWIFDSFWGQFGWMRVDFVRGSFWEPVIAVAMAIGLVGAAVALIRPGTLSRAPMAALLALVLAAPALLFVNALVDAYPIQQGRYLFPVLPALAATLAAGQAALVPARGRSLWLIAWLGLWLSLAAAALITLGAVYL